MTTKTKNIQVSFTEEQYNHLLKMAKKSHKSITNVIRDAVEQAYDIEESNQSVSENATENVEKKLRKERQLEAFNKARGIWKNRSDIDDILKEIDERWRQWEKKLEKYA